MAIADSLRNKFGNAVCSAVQDYGDETVVVERGRLFEILEFLKTNPDCPFDLLLDICGVDYLGANQRFEVTYHLYSLPKKARFRVRVKLPESDPVVPSVVKLWEAADWFEREAFDMFGIKFEGHPKLKRLLMWEEFEGYPLRKDYPLDKRQAIPIPADIV